MKGTGWITVRVRVNDLPIPPLATRKELREAFMAAIMGLPRPPEVDEVEIMSADWHVNGEGRWVEEHQHRFGNALVARTRTHHQYNRTVHEVELLEGEWPDRDQLILWLGGIKGCGWGTAELGKVNGAVSIAGCD